VPAIRQLKPLTVEYGLVHYLTREIKLFQCFSCSYVLFTPQERTFYPFFAVSQQLRNFHYSTLPPQVANQTVVADGLGLIIKQLRDGHPLVLSMIVRGSFSRAANAAFWDLYIDLRGVIDFLHELLFL